MMMRKKAKKRYARGGMPSIEESVKSGNRVSRQVGAETKKLMPEKKRAMPPIGESVKSGNRMSGENAKDLKAVKKYAKGGKVKRYADGDLVMGGAASDISGLSLGMPKIDTDLRRAMTDKELMDANLAAVRRREAEDMAAKAAPKPKPKPRAAAPTKKAEAPAKKPETPPAKPAPAKPAAERPRVGIQNLKNKMASGRSSADNRAAVKSGIKAIAGLPGRAARALESANEQTKTQARNMKAARAKNPNLFERMAEAANPYKKAAGGKVSSRGDGIARKGKTKGKMI
jgi:hypothetical protein